MPVGTVLVLVYLFGIESYSSQILIVVFPWGTSQIPDFLFLVPLIISCPFFWTDISCLSVVMVHISSHKTPNVISGDVFIFGEIWIYLACLLIPGSWSVPMGEDSMVIPSGSLDIISFEIITGAIVVVAFISRFIFTPESVIANILLLG